MFWRKKSEDNNINLLEEVSLLKEVVNKQNILIEDLVKQNKGLLENCENVNVNIYELTNMVEYNFEQVKDQLNLQNELEITTNKEPETYRTYSKSIIKEIPILNKVEKDGKLITKNNRTAPYTIYDLQKLVKYIPETQQYSTWLSFAEKMDMNVTTLQRLCAGIELKYYESIFKQWKIIQNTITKPDVIYVNNPEKRKELGMGGY